MKKYTLIKPRGIYSPEKKTIEQGVNILVRGNTIAETASDRKLQSGILKQIDPAMVETIDLADRYVLPDMCDNHVHSTFSATTET